MLKLKLNQYFLREDILKVKKLGMRTVKTGIAVGLSVLAEKIFVQNAVLTALACLVSVQDSVRGSILAGLSRIKGTIIGGIIGFLFALIGGTGNALIATLGIITTIYICNHFNLTNEISISCVTFIAIHLGDIDTTLIAYSLNRILDTSVGVIIGVVVNYSLARPKHTNNIHYDLLAVEQCVSKYLEYKILKKSTKYSTHSLGEIIVKLDKSYNNFINEFSYLQESECEMDGEIDNLVVLSKELYFHIQSIEMLEQKLYLNKANSDKIKYLYGLEDLNWDISENKSPVFNYHLKKVLKQINLLRLGIESQFSSDGHTPMHVIIKKNLGI